MGDSDLPPTLKDLDARLRKVRKAREPEAGPTPAVSNLGLALRVGIEMVAALLVGGGMGWLLDDWLGTRPWLLLVFLLLGVTAGLLNAYRASKRVSAEWTEKKGDGGGSPRAD